MSARLFGWCVMTHRKLLVGLLAFLFATGVTRAFAALGDPAPRTYSDGVEGLALPIPSWEQANSSGFGDPQTLEVTALEAFNGYLYAGTYNPIDPEPLFDGAQVFRSPDGVTWTAVTQPGFGTAHDNAPPAILDFIVFNNRLFAGTGRGNASQVWSSLNGLTWAPMNVTGFSDPDNVNVTAFAVYGGMIYAGVTNEVTGAQVWRSFSGGNNTWEQVAPAVPGTAPASITGFAEFPFDGGLYAAVEFEADAPVQVWRTYGGDWETVMDDGFGDAATLSTGGMTVFLGDLYVGTVNEDTGVQLWRSSDGDIWTPAVTPGISDPNNQEIEMLSVVQNRLYAGVRNMVTGIEIWRTADGVLWEQINPDGFGDSNNTGTNYSNSMVEFQGRLCTGTSNVVDGGELWRTMTPVTGVGDLPAQPAVFALRPAVPNPSRSGARVAFDLTRDGPVSLEVFDVAGRLVRTLVQGPRPAGVHEVSWNGDDDAGHAVAAGVYLYRLRGEGLELTRRLVIVR